MPSFARVPQFADLAPGRRRPPAAPRTVLHKQAPPMRTACACGGSCPHCSGLSANGTNIDRGWQVDGVPAIASFEDAGDMIAIDAPDVSPTTSPTVPATPAMPASPATPAAATCPTRIKVASIIPIVLKENNVGEGFLTGVGGVAVMEVGDASGRDWAGTAIHENIMSGTNTCKNGVDACPNSQGQNGSGGSTFKVGDPMNGFVTLPSRRNTFYDMHMFALRPSILHQNNLATCETSCRQVYDCGGQVFGPVFTIHKTMTRDTIMSGGKAVDVTRVRLDKPQDRSAPGDFPGPNLPPGENYG
jgi:hypothetical protein